MRFTAELERKLTELAAESGRSADELVQDAVPGMFDELADTREMLDRRYRKRQGGADRRRGFVCAFARTNHCAPPGSVMSGYALHRCGSPPSCTATATRVRWPQFYGRETKAFGELRKDIRGIAVTLVGQRD